MTWGGGIYQKGQGQVVRNPAEGPSLLATNRKKKEIPMAKTGKNPEKDSIVPDGLSSLGEAVGLANAQTPCEVMGQNEILTHEIAVNRTDEVVCRLFLCNTPARAVLGIADALGHQKVLANQKLPPPNPLTVTVMPPSPPAGRYALIWALFQTGPDWQMVAEVAVKGTVVFRQFRGAKSKVPVPRGFLMVEVL
jgi:hypothetical protein